MNLKLLEVQIPKAILKLTTIRTLRTTISTLRTTLMQKTTTMLVEMVMVTVMPMLLASTHTDKKLIMMV